MTSFADVLDFYDGGWCLNALTKDAEAIIFW